MQAVSNQQVETTRADPVPSTPYHSWRDISKRTFCHSDLDVLCILESSLWEGESEEASRDSGNLQITVLFLGGLKQPHILHQALEQLEADWKGHMVKSLQNCNLGATDRGQAPGVINL